MSRYKIKEDSTNNWRLYRYDEDRGPPNNAEFQFWSERNQARRERDMYKAALEKILPPMVVSDKDACKTDCKCQKIAREALAYRRSRED